MPKLPEFKTKPIKGVKEDELDKYTLRYFASIENGKKGHTKEAIKKRVANTDYVALQKKRVKSMDWAAQQAKRIKSMDFKAARAKAEITIRKTKKGWKPVDVYKSLSKKVGNKWEYKNTFYKRYDSITNASLDLGIHSGTIHNVLNPKHIAKSIKGFTFKYSKLAK